MKGINSGDQNKYYKRNIKVMNYTNKDIESLEKKEPLYNKLLQELQRFGIIGKKELMLLKKNNRYN
jgi:hypothetical protein